MPFVRGRWPFISPGNNAITGRCLPLGSQSPFPQELLARLQCHTSADCLALWLLHPLAPSAVPHDQSHSVGPPRHPALAGGRKWVRYENVWGNKLTHSREVMVSSLLVQTVPDTHYCHRSWDTAAVLERKWSFPVDLGHWNSDVMDSGREPVQGFMVFVHRIQVNQPRCFLGLPCFD